MAAYAEGTKVSSAASQAEIVKMLHKFGVTKYGFFNDGDDACLAFSFGGLTYRIVVLMPPADHDAFHHTAAGRRKSPTAARASWEQECRRRWRSLGLVIKAKLVAVEDEITTFENEFLAYVVTDDGTTFGERAIPQLKQAAIDGKIPAALPMPGMGVR